MMIYKFKITSPDQDHFEREIEIAAEQTWLDLHHAIQAATGYAPSQMASFFQIDKSGQRGLEISLIEMNADEEDSMSLIAMDVASIKEFVSKDFPDLIYVFDFFSDRFFYVRLLSVSVAKPNKQYPVCVKSEGNAPVQIMMDDSDFPIPNSEEPRKDETPEKIADDYLIDFEDELNSGPKFESLDDYEDSLIS